MEDSYKQQLNHSNLSQSDAKSSLATPHPPPRSLPRAFLTLGALLSISTGQQRAAQSCRAVPRSDSPGFTWDHRAPVPWGPEFLP